MTALRGAGFDLSAANYAGSAGGGGPDHCTLLMLALSYADPDECYPSFANDKFATVLLEQGVDTRIGRTSAGLTALDIVRRRIENGPDSPKFATIRERMMKQNAAAGAPTNQGE